MDRREFIHSAAAVAVGIGATTPAFGGIAGAALGRQVERFREGQQFTTACGARLRLAHIVERNADPRVSQFGLLFEGDACARLGEGLQTLHGEQGQLVLFLQPAEAGLVAWFGQLS